MGAAPIGPIGPMAVQIWRACRHRSRFLSVSSKISTFFTATTARSTCESKETAGDVVVESSISKNMQRQVFSAERISSASYRTTQKKCGQMARSVSGQKACVPYERLCKRPHSRLCQQLYQPSFGSLFSFIFNSFLLLLHPCKTTRKKQPTGLTLIESAKVNNIQLSHLIVLQAAQGHCIWDA